MVYTLIVSYDHTFFVGSARVLVHNASGCYGMASQLEDLSGKPRAEVDTLLQARGATKKATAGGYTHYRFPDRSEIVIRPDAELCERLHQSMDPLALERTEALGSISMDD